MNTANTREGFAPIAIVLIIAIIAVGGAASYFLVSRQESSEFSSPLSSRQSETEKQTEEAESARPTPQAPPQKTKPTVSADPKLLEGLWRIETAYEWVNPPGVWRESRELSARIPYQEFKEGQMCRIWGLRIFKQLTGQPTLEQALDKMYCSSYKPIRSLGESEYKPQEKDVAAIAFVGEQYGTIYTWKIVDGKLELAEPGARGIYVKIPGSRDLQEESKDTTGPSIISFTINQQSFGMGEEVKLKCVANDERYIMKFNLAVAGVGPNNGSFNTSSEGGPDELGGDSRALTFAARMAGTYTATCKAVDDSGNESAASTVRFSVN